MLGRILLLLTAAAVTMGAVVAPAGSGTAFEPVDRRPAAQELAAVTRAAEGPGALAAVRRAVAHTPGLDAASPVPALVSRWWSGLSDATRSVLEAGAPGVIGNLEGLPYAVRDRANRAVLHVEIAGAERRLEDGGGGRGEALVTSTRLETMQQVAAALQRKPGSPVRRLVLLDPADGGRAAVAVGDPDTADDVAFLVPGMYFSVRQQLVDWTRTAAGIQAEETTWLARFKERRSAAVVAWIGYRTPDALSVVSAALAQQGANRLAAAVDGLHAARPEARPYTTVLAHSYGATATALALKAHAFAVDALAMVGSPGSPATDARQLAVPDGQVYVGEAAWDEVATSGFFGTDPTTSAFGAVRLGAAGGVDPISGLRLHPAFGHNGYFDPGTESIRNIALIAIRHGADVTDGAEHGGVLALAVAPHPASAAPRSADRGLNTLQG